MRQGDVVHLVFMQQGRRYSIGFGGQQPVLGIRNAGCNHLRLVHLFVQLHLLDNRFYQTACVRSVIDGEARRVVGVFDFACQDPQEHGVKGAHGEIAHLFGTHLSGNAALHFRCGLVRKGEGHDFVGRDAALQQVGNLVRQHAGLARASAGYDKQVSLIVEHRLALCLV